MGVRQLPPHQFNPLCHTSVLLCATHLCCFVPHLCCVLCLVKCFLCHSLNMRVLVYLCSLVCLSSALPSLYNVDRENVAKQVLIPVSSTVIPLEDLPELQVGFGFGLVDQDKVKKPPAYLKDIKLITHKNRHRFVAPGGVKQLTKEEFEAFNSP